MFPSLNLDADNNKTEGNSNERTRCVKGSVLGVRVGEVKDKSDESSETVLYFRRVSWVEVCYCFRTYV